jgi:hypothetical protein
VDLRETARIEHLESARARAALSSRLPFQVLEVGEKFRRYGAASAADRPGGTASELADLRRSAQTALRMGGSEPLLALRALETQMFLDALSSWQTTGAQSRDLTELAGPFITKASENEWIIAPSNLLLSQTERSTFFRIRWGELTGLGKTNPFQPALVEWKVYYRFLLEHPERPQPGRGTIRLELDYATALARRDPQFPIALTRGVLLYRLGAYAAAGDAFRAHLAENPDGRWRLRARNYLAAALERSTQAAEPTER